MVPHHYAAVERDVRGLFAPRMSVDFFEAVPLRWVHVEDLLQQIFKLVGDKIGQHVLARQDLLVKLRRVVVLEW